MKKLGLAVGLGVAVFWILLGIAGCDSGGVESTNGPKACTSDSDCPDGSYCDTMLNLCMPNVSGEDGDAEFSDTFDSPDKDSSDLLDDSPSEKDVNEAEEIEEAPVDTDGRKIFVSPSELDFGFVLFGQSNSKELTISNKRDATEDLNVSQISFIHDESEIDFTYTIRDGLDLPRTLAPGEFFVVDVTYTPSDAVPDLGEELLISSDDADNPLVRVPLLPKYKGAAHLLVEPSEVAFGEVPVGGVISQTITITNGCDPDGNQVLRIDSIALASSGGLVGNDFTVAPSQTPSADAPVYLNPGESIDVTVTYAPSDEGEKSDTLYILSNDNEYPAPGLAVSLSGMGIAADMQVLPNPVEFGPVRIGSDKSIEVHITNLGEDVLNISSISLRDSDTDFSIDSGGNSSWSLNTQEEAVITLHFQPVSSGEQSTRLVIISDGDVSNYQVPVHGIGASSRIELSSSELDFGDVQVDSTASMSVSVISAGELPLNISSIEVQDPTGAFALVDDSNYYTPINPEFERSVVFTFTPPGTGANWQAVAKIFSDANNTDADGSVSIVLKASSTDPNILVIPQDRIEFDPVELGQTDTKQITVKNVGSGVLKIFEIHLSGGSSPYMSVSGTPVVWPVELEHNDFIQFNVEYTPGSAGEATGSVIITHNDHSLFGAGDLDRTDYEVILHAQGTINHKPIAVLNVNGTDSCPVYVDFDSLITLTDTGSYDPDADDTITAWQYRIENAPSGHNELNCSENMCSVNANKQGQWLFSLRVQDNRGLWSDKVTCEVEVSEPPNQRPVANIRANGSDTDIDVVVGEQVVFDDLGSSDADGYITDWNFYISSAPAGYNALTGTGNSRSLDVNVSGSWNVCLKVKDDDGEWSDPDCIGLSATPPPNQHMKIVLDKINWADCFHLSITPPSSVGSEACDEAHAPQCSWGPTHTGAPQGLPSNNGSSVEITWSTENYDGIYSVRVERSGEVGGISCSILAAETTDLTFYRDNVAFYSCSMEWSIAGTDTWDLTWQRLNGVWNLPQDHSGLASCEELLQR